jgi:hypothetical protein
MVSAAPDARTSFAVTGIQTESLPLAVSVSGKRDFGARFPGNGISGPEKNAQKPPADCNAAVSEERTVARIPANSGLFVLFQEISGSIRLRGGPGRIRTSNQAVMSGRPGSTRVRAA